MALFSVFSILVVAVAASGAYSGLIPDIIPNLPTKLVPVPVPVTDTPVLPKIIPTPGSKDEAVGQIRRGCGIGKKGINLRISAFVALANSNPALPPLCKKCIAEKANQIREQTLASIDATGNAIVEEIDAQPESWVAVWVAIINDLPSLILGVLGDCKQQLDTAKSDCIAQTSSP